jgi:hypothetical protein
VCINNTSVPHNKLRHRKTTNYRRQSIDSFLKYVFRKNYMSRNMSRIFMFLCTTVQYEYMNLLRNDVSNLFVKKQVRIKIYWEFYHGIIYIANEGRHLRIKNRYLIVVHFLFMSRNVTSLVELSSIFLR